MTPRLVVLAGLCATLGALLVVGELTDPAGPAAIEYTLPALDAVDRVRIRMTGQPDVELRRVGDAWRVLPADAPLDRFADRDLRAVFAAPVPMDRAESVPTADLGRYALTEHAPTVEMLAGETQLAAFRVGKVVDGRRTFIRPLVGEDRVLRAQGNLRRIFDRPADSWRERRLFDAEADELARLTVRRGDRIVWRADRAHAQAEWILTEPAGLVPAQDALHGVAYTLATAEAAGWPGPDAAAGFHPRTEVVGETFDGRRLALALAAPGPDGSALARSLPDGGVVTLAQRFAHFLDAPLDALRERRVLRFGDAEPVEVVFGGATPIRIRRTDGAWRMVEPRDAALDEARAEAVLALLGDLRAAGFAPKVPENAFAAPFHTVVVRLADDRQVVLTIGAAYQGGARYARTDDSPETNYVLAAETVDALRPAPEALLPGPGTTSP